MSVEVIKEEKDLTGERHEGQAGERRRRRIGDSVWSLVSSLFSATEDIPAPDKLVADEVAKLNGESDPEIAKMEEATENVSGKSSKNGMFKNAMKVPESGKSIIKKVGKSKNGKNKKR